MPLANQGGVNGEPGSRQAKVFAVTVSGESPKGAFNVNVVKHCAKGKEAGPRRRPTGWHHPCVRGQNVNSEVCKREERSTALTG